MPSDSVINTQHDFNAIKKGLQTFSHIDEIESILKTRFKDFCFHTLKDIPHPKELYNNMEASLFVCQSILKNEKIVIVGDYDTDGICATSIILDFFDQLSYNNVAFAMPNRFIHGYGFSTKLFHEILKEHSDVKVIITVDNGVSSFQAADLCREHNIGLIITDHHTLEVDSNKSQKIPCCNFMINPQQAICNFPYSEICGSLVAWYFCCAIKISMLNLCSDSNAKNNQTKKFLNCYEKNLKTIRMESFLLLVGIATIADVMPLNAINHTICKYALKHIPNSKRYAFQALMENLKSSIDSQVLGFRIIPLLNAAGRISDGKIALSFLRANSLPNARFYLKQLKDLNAQRKHLQDEVTNKAFQSISQIPQNENMLCAVGEDWHEGVLGIVAGKMADEFQKPCFVLTNTNGVCKGSGRSAGDVDLISSMQKIGHLMQRYGGHVGAVGLELKDYNLESFIKSFKPISHNIEKKENVLGILNSHLINYELFSCITSFEPFGNGNPLPKFLCEMEILECRKTGQGFSEFHFKRTENSSIKGMFFNQRYADYNFTIGSILYFRATIALDSQNFYTTQNRQIMLIIDRVYTE
ncbi:DHH family phosphoesterase [Helicobacter bilis]|uniref:single-stranded-DNA-specific exonuclease RecJ n=1 Tax=Helicobacter bilis TaxID=37372 RepID=UPI0026EFC69B|nr:DHH family phosphoesterase [Helicobacter bilis]MCI7411210.1 DHH family phosphoesterase [Helicobacter bilis]MDD7297601.1 DHH family phosphoesterase [Helicobacter bilis]MDY4399604.1 DHH family phosphoesterase [Helicobacter bilis]